MADRTPEERTARGGGTRPPGGPAASSRRASSRSALERRSPDPSTAARATATPPSPPTPFRPSRGRQAVAERPPLSRAARAQRIGRPGRPEPAAAGAQAQALVPPPPRPARARRHRGGAVCRQRDLPAVPGHGEEGTGIPVRGRVGRQRDRDRRAARAQGRHQGRALLRGERDAQPAPQHAADRQLPPARQHDQRRRDRGAPAGPEGARGQDLPGHGAGGPVAPRGGAAGPRGRRRGLLPEGVEQPLGDHARPAAGPAGRPQDDRGLPVPGHVRAQGRRHRGRAGHAAADGVPPELPQGADGAGARPRPDALRRRDHRVDDRARDPVGPRAPADRRRSSTTGCGRASRSSIDATIRYRENNWSRPLRKSELERDGAYNTRLRKGLPPTPIGSPGLASLRAAARPARTRYLFYVAKPGACHAFSRTDAQFERDVAAYERAKEANGGRAPKQKC